MTSADGSQWDYFISYAQADREFAEWIAWHLEEAGYRVLIPSWDMVPGANLLAEIPEGLQRSDRTIAVLSDAYVRSTYSSAEWHAVIAADPSGTQRRLLPVRIADCARPGLLGNLRGIDLFGIPEDEARRRLLGMVAGARTGRAKPDSAPSFPGAGPGRAPVFPPEATAQVWEVAEVFQPTGVPEVTFVQPEWFAEFLLALRQPGLSVVLEGPSGAGKTTLLQHAIDQDARRLGQPRRFTARDPAHVTAIADLVSGGDHNGIVAIDDFHRLPADLQAKVVDYLKLLADRGDRTRKLVIVGIPQTAQTLVRISFDIANRIRAFRLGWAADRQILGLIEQGAKALNIAFDDKPALVSAAAGSLITAQSLCAHLMAINRIEETMPALTAVQADVDKARGRVFHELRIKYHEAVAAFASLGGRDDTACIDVLLALAAERDGVLYLDDYVDRHPGQAAALASRALAGQTGSAVAASETMSRVLYYDPTGRRLIADDPQFIFYLRHLDRPNLMKEAGKRPPPTRHRVFLCYSHANDSWMRRLMVHLGPLHKDKLIDVWSDKRIRPGDDWRTEIDAALSAARFAVPLVSADFYNSTFIRDVELPALLAAADTGGCKVMPLLVTASRFSADPALARFQAVNRDGRTLAAMTEEQAEQVLADLAASIEDEIRRLN